MHAESGYFRPKPDGSIEVVIAQSSGLVEVQVKDLITLTSNKQTLYLLIIIDFQKGAYNVDKQTITLKSELIGNASKVIRHDPLCDESFMF